MAGRRGRPRARSSGDDEPESYYQDNEPWSAKPIDEDAIPGQLKGSYRDAGYSCKRCQFVTKKTGFSGKQSLRAHLKAHAREDTAFRRAARKGLVWLVLSLAVLALLVWSDPFPELNTQEIVVSVLVGLGTLVLAFFQVRISYGAAQTFDRKHIKLAQRLLVLSRGVALVGLVTGHLAFVHWYALTAVPLLMFVGIYTATSIAYADIQGKRGKFRSARYSRLIRPGGLEAERNYNDYKRRLYSGVFTGHIKPQKARGWLKKHFRLLGMHEVWRRGAQDRKGKRQRKQEAERRRKRRKQRRSRKR